MEHAKAAVLANPELKSSFDIAMNYIAEFATEQELLQAKSRNISQVNTRGTGGGRGQGGPGRGRGSKTRWQGMWRLRRLYCKRQF